MNISFNKAPILQLRAAINSKGDWTSKWKTAVINTI